MSLKLTEESCAMTMKNDAKFEEELTCCFKTDMRNLTNFDSRTLKSEKVFYDQNKQKTQIQVCEHL